MPPTRTASAPSRNSRPSSRVKTVRHPYILSLERYDIIDGQLIIVMELADRNLWDRFKECRDQGLPGIPRDELLGYMEETAEALDLMNSSYQLQHLDIKPQNLFLVHNHIKVADFGLVKDLEGMTASVTGGVTPVYAAPETFDGWVSRFSDQYSLAIVYQELLTGQRPFTGNNVRQLILQHLQGTPNLTPLPAGDRAVIARGLAKKPGRALSHLPRNGARPACRHRRPSAGDREVVAPETDAVAARAARKRRWRRTSDRKSRAPDPAVGPRRPASDRRRRPRRSPAARPRSGHALGRRAAPASRLRAPRQARSRPSSDRHRRGDPASRPGGRLGGAGLPSLRHLLRRCSRAPAPSQRLPTHLRFLYLDTDPDGAAGRDARPARTSLASDEVLLARLQPAQPLSQVARRPARHRVVARSEDALPHPAQPRPRPAAAPWAAWRFAINYRPIAQRLRVELEACSDPEALKAAAQRTRLGLRTARPRVYIVASLAGGTRRRHVPRPGLRDAEQSCATWDRPTPTWSACSCCRRPTAPRPTRCPSATPAPH